MSWRETWRATVESFLREVRDPADPEPGRTAADPVAGAIAGARTEVRDLEEELRVTRGRADAEAESVAVCERRKAQAERTGDGETARVAERFCRRHAERLAVLRRKAQVLEDELRLARATLNELLDLARPDGDGV
jgi:hypothetical protein